MWIKKSKNAIKLKKYKQKYAFIKNYILSELEEKKCITNKCRLLICNFEHQWVKIFKFYKKIIQF